MSSFCRKPRRSAERAQPLDVDVVDPHRLAIDVAVEDAAGLPAR